MSGFISAANQINGFLQIGSSLLDYRDAIENEEILEKVNELAHARLSHTSSSYKSLIHWQQCSETFKKWTHEKDFEKAIGGIGLISAFCIVWEYLTALLDVMSSVFSSNEVLKAFDLFAQTLSQFFSSAPVSLIFKACSWVGVVFSSCEAIMAIVKICKLSDEIDAIKNKIQEHPELEAVLEKEIEILTLKQNEAKRDLAIAVISIALFIAASIASGGTASLGFAVAAAAITLVLQIYKSQLHKGNKELGEELNKSLVDLITNLGQNPDEAARGLLNDCLIMAFREIGDIKKCEEILEQIGNRQPSDLTKALNDPQGWGIVQAPQSLMEAYENAQKELETYLALKSSESEKAV
jgi:hypothetical protein